MNKKNNLTRVLFALALTGLIFAFSCDQMLISMSMNLSATKGDYTNKIHLSWNEPTIPDNDDDGYPDDYVTGYDIYRDGGLYDSIPVSTTYYDDYSISADTEYEYYVDANLNGSIIPVTSSTVIGYAIRKEVTTLWSTLAGAQAHPVITTGWGQSTWHQVYLQKGWTYHFIADGYSSAPAFSIFRIYKKDNITDALVSVIGPSTPEEYIYICPSSGYYWIRVEGNDDFQFYAWYQ